MMRSYIYVETYSVNYGGIVCAREDSGGVTEKGLLRNA